MPVGLVLVLGLAWSGCSRDWDELIDEARRREADGGAADGGTQANDDGGAGPADVDAGADGGSMGSPDGGPPEVDAGCGPDGCVVDELCKDAGGDDDGDGICDDDDLCIGDNDSGNDDGDEYCNDRETIIYVRTDGDDTASGETWDDAVATVQQGIDLALDGCYDVWVAEGDYFPTTDDGDPEPPDPHTLSIFLRPCVGVYGGFSGDEGVLTDRPTPLRPTVLSGDIGALGDESDNAYHVVTATDNTVLDGFTIAAGYAFGASAATNSGGGIRGDGADFLLLRDLVVLQNQAERGAGILLEASQDVKLQRVVIRENSASLEGGGLELIASRVILDETQLVRNTGPLGAGLQSLDSDVWLLNSLVQENDGLGVHVNNASIQDVPVRLTDSILFANTGGGLSALEAQLVLERTVVVANDGAAMGGGVSYTGGNTEVSQSAFAFNYSTDLGAAIYTPDTKLTLVDGSFVDNYAELGGGAIFAGGDLDVSSSGFAHNGTNGDGGAIATAGQTTINVVNSAFVGNNASQGSGGAMSMLGMSTARVSGCSFFANDAYNVGGVLRFEGPELLLLNTAAFENLPDMVASLGGSTIVDWLCSDNPPPGATNAITLDGSTEELAYPFIYPYSDQLYLSQVPGYSASACVDAGYDAIADDDVPGWAGLTTDLLSSGSVDAPAVDLGRHYDVAQPTIDDLVVSGDVFSWGTHAATRCALLLYGEDVNLTPIVQVTGVDDDLLQSGSEVLPAGYTGAITLVCFGDAGEPAVATYQL